MHTIDYLKTIFHVPQFLFYCCILLLAICTICVTIYVIQIFMGVPVLVLRRRTRAAFDVAVKAHRSIQARDIEVGRNIGNFILRCLDRIKPSARIRGPSQLSISGGNSKKSMTKPTAGASNHKPPSHSVPFKKDSDRHLFTALTPKPFPSISRMMIPPNPAGTTIHGRYLSTYSSEVFRQNYKVNWSGSVIRKDIMQWMLQN